jgi:hypothetical protein
MNTVEIPLKISGLAEIKAELRALKGELANATDPQQMAELAQRAGELKDQIADANEAANTFATGSKFEQVSNGLGGIKDSLMSLDFDEASQKSKVFSAALGKINPAEIGKGMKGLMSTITTLGGAFVKLGATILVNPIFLIVAAVVAIVAVIVVLMQKFGILQTVLDTIMAPVNALIAGFEALTDWLGLTTNALDDKHEKSMQALEAEDKRLEQSNQLRNRVHEQEMGGIDRQIALAAAQGKDTTDLTKKKIRGSIEYQKQQMKEIDLQIKSVSTTLAELEALNAKKKAQGQEVDLKDQEQLTKKLNDLKNQRVQVNESILNSENQLKVMDAEAARKLKEKAGKTGAKKDIEAALKAELDLKRAMRDQELAMMKDGAEKEQEIIKEKYKRLSEDLKNDSKKTAAQKLEYEKIYQQQLNNELKTSQEDREKKEKENLIKANEAILQLRLELMPEGEAKEKAMQDEKYRKLREAAIADTTLTEEKRNEILELYEQQRAQEDNAKELEKQKAKDDFAQKFALEQMTQSEQELEALRVKYEEERKLAEGNAALLLELQNKYIDDQEKIQQAADARQVEEAQKKRDALIQASSDIFNGLSNLGGMMIKDQKKLEKFNKASALIQIGIDTAKAISALVAASQANPANAATFGAAGVAQFATGIIQIATNIAKAKQILSSGGTPSTGGGGGGGGGGSSSTAQVIPQAAQLFGQGNTSGTMSAGGTSTESSGMTVTAVVSETAMTTVQNRINRINKNAEL